MTFHVAPLPSGSINGVLLVDGALLVKATALVDAGSHCAEGTRASTGLPNAAAAVKGEMGGG